MKFVAIMGRNNSGKSTVETHLENMGFKRSISYTTREPQVRNGKQEENGNEYFFTTKDKFLQLYEKGKIIEYEEYGHNLYGTTRPYGATRYVAVLCVNCVKALKELFGEQVLAVYLKCDADVAKSRSKLRDNGTELYKIRHEEDEAKIIEMESIADVVIDSNQDMNKMLADILKALRDKNI